VNAAWTRAAFGNSDKDWVSGLWKGSKFVLSTKQESDTGEDRSVRMPNFVYCLGQSPKMDGVWSMLTSRAWTTEMTLTASKNSRLTVGLAVCVMRNMRFNHVRKIDRTAPMNSKIYLTLLSSFSQNRQHIRTTIQVGRSLSAIRLLCQQG
jgi:hypothetical protein